MTPSHFKAQPKPSDDAEAPLASPIRASVDAQISSRFTEYVERSTVDHRVVSSIEDEFGALVAQYRNIRSVSLVASLA